ncbi:MAG: helix-turn-helix domain-containing protein, partial [Candidatus Gastranaerophilales bacterium]|nr:helix-turn-helix domain-containing protein [Candidatus Gastranaerophilales bacterium]
VMNNELQTKLGQRIKQLRLTMGLSQEKLAEKLDIAINTLSNIERGNSFMTSATIEKLVKIFGISYEELFSFGGSHEDNVDLYDKIIFRLNLIKNSPEKLKIFETITKLFI